MGTLLIRFSETRNAVIGRSFQAFQEQLGLKLEATKALADTLVIDKAEKPFGELKNKIYRGGDIHKALAQKTHQNSAQLR